MQEATQKCTVCGRELSLSVFGRDKRNIDSNGGYSKRCKDCACAAARRRYQENKEEIRKKQQARRQKDKKIKWVQKVCPACGSKIMVKTRIGKCFCQECGVEMLVSGALGGEPGMQVKRANTHGIRLSAVKGVSVW